MTNKEFKKIQENLGFSNPEMADFLNMSLSSIKGFRSGDIKLTKKNIEYLKLKIDLG